MPERDVAKKQAKQRHEESDKRGQEFDFIPSGSIRELLDKVEELPKGKNVFPLGSPEERVVLVIDKNLPGGHPVEEVANIIFTGNPAEVHNRETDIVTGVMGEMCFVIGGTLINPELAAKPDGTNDPNELRGDGIRFGRKIIVRPGDMLIIPAGTPHVHGTKPGEIAAATFVKRREVRTSSS